MGKVFTIQGPYNKVRASLRKRGWIEKFYKMTPRQKKTPRAKKSKRDTENDDDNDDDDDGDSSGDDDYDGGFFPRTFSRKVSLSYIFRESPQVA